MGVREVRDAFLAGAAFAAVEWGASPVSAPSLDAGLGTCIAAVAGLGLLHALMAAPLGRLGASALVAPVILWAMVWGPERARDFGLVSLWGFAAPASLLVVGVRWPRLSAALAVLGALLCARPDEPQRGETHRPDIVLVTVDTTRVDSDILASAGALGPDWHAGRAIAAAPWTPPSIHSLMTGLPVVAHQGGIEAHGEITLRSPDAGAIASDLRGRGYATAAFVANPHLSAEAGFREGYAHWVHALRHPAPITFLSTGRGALRRWFGISPSAGHTDRALTDAATRWLQLPRRAPRFVWLHLMGPHCWPREDVRGVQVAAPAAAEGRHQRYAALVGRAGQVLHDFLVELPTEATVIVTSDHGESLGDAGRWGHGWGLSTELVEVPISVRGGHEVGATVRHTDVRSFVAAVADGDLAMMPEADEVALGGVRSHPAQTGRWREAGIVLTNEGTVPAEARRVPRSETLRAELRALGYEE